MTRPDQTEMVFTLSEDDSTGEPDWARTLNALRTRNRATAATPQTIAAEAQREQLARELSDSYPNTNTLRPFGDRELDAAYREYLHQAAAEQFFFAAAVAQNRAPTACAGVAFACAVCV